MKIAVFTKLVPDLVEELSIDASGTSLDTTWLRLIINEFDDHAIEQAILLKEKSPVEVIIISPEYDGIDEVLFTGLAKGADRAIKMIGDINNINNHGLAKATLQLLNEIKPDLILTGVQANNDMDGSIGMSLAGYLDLPYIGYVSGIILNEQEAIVHKEYPGGVIAEMSVQLPAVLGIQAAEHPPRYVAVSKVRQVMKTSKIDEYPALPLDNIGGLTLDRMYKPRSTTHAEMIQGTPDQVADRLVGIFKEIGII